MKFAHIVILSLSIFISACATHYPQNREEQATYYVNEAKSAISKEDCSTAGIQIDSALSRPTGDTKIRELFTNSQKGQECYFFIF